MLVVGQRVLKAQIWPLPTTPGGTVSGGTFDSGISFCFCFFNW
jgi:hypothetical protein